MYTAIITGFVTVLLSLCATIIMTYISMAAPIGPWIAPTMLLCAMMLLRVLQRRYQSAQLALITSAASIGGILATAFGFSFPALHFLDAIYFNQLLQSPFLFSLTVSGLALCAGGIGMICANYYEHEVIIQQELAFPVGQLIYKMIAAGNQMRKALELIIGFIGASIYGIIRSGIYFIHGLLPRAITLIAGRSWGIFACPTIRVDLDIMPMLLAIGFVTGHVIAIPLLVGVLSKSFFIGPVHQLFFSILTDDLFMLAFCSGMVLSGALLSFAKLPFTIYNSIRSYRVSESLSFSSLRTKKLFVEGVVWLLFAILFLTYCGFSLLAQCFLIIGACICAYQLIYIAGQTGLAPLGRFATFVMVPGMFLFKLTAAQIVIFATTVEAVGGVACDILFGRKIAYLASIPTATMKRFQYAGLLISAASIGIVFWLFMNKFGVGTELLCVYKAQSRALLVQSLLSSVQFNYLVLMFGALFGYLLGHMKINPMLVLGGLLMPYNVSLCLVVGGLLSNIPSDREAWYPLWSGVFAGNSIWMLVQAMVG